jgi:UDP:flavonoid glycosyltransferase YjiC (YdhE family)
MGHATPVIRLAKVLVDAGHDVHFLTFLYNNDKITGMFSKMEMDVPIYYCDEGNPIDHVNLLANMGRGTGVYREAIEKIIKEVNPDIIISDIIAHIIIDVVDKLGIYP